MTKLDLYVIIQKKTLAYITKTKYAREYFIFVHTYYIILYIHIMFYCKIMKQINCKKLTPPPYIKNGKG